MGLSGIAWGMSTIGLEDVAEHLCLRSTKEHPLLYAQGDLFYGLSGFGLSCLKHYSLTNDEYWLNEAQLVGQWLRENSQENDTEIYTGQTKMVKLGLDMRVVQVEWRYFYFT